MLRTRVLSGDGLFSELETDWKELVRGSENATPFQTFEWMSTWWRHFGALKTPQALAIYEGDDLVGLFPMSLSRGIWRSVRPMGLGSSDYLHPLAVTGYEASVNEAVAGYLRELDVDLIDLHQVREDRASFAGALKATHLEQAACLVLDLPSRYEDYVSRLSKSLRYDVKRLDKMVFKEGKASIERVGPDEVQKGLDYLFELHRARWRKRGLPGAFLASGARFHRDWAAQASREGWLWLSILRLEDRPIGAIYAMNLGATTYYYQAGFDPDCGSVSPGTLLVADSIRRSIEEGGRQFDFLRGAEDYKRRWKPQHEYKNYRTILRGPGAVGRLASKWNWMGFKVESRIRARLEGRGLV